MRHILFSPVRTWIASTVLATGLSAGCAQPPVQTGSNHVPEVDAAIAAAKDGKFGTLSWPLVDTLMTSALDGATAPGCAVGVAIEDEIVYLKGYGRARLAPGAEDWSVSTMGAVGSVSKTFTALAAMRQVQDTWMGIEERAGDRLPLSGELANTTLVRLLSHTSGAGGASKKAASAPNWTHDSPIDQCKNVATPDPADPYCTEAHRAALDPVALVESYADGEADNVTPLSAVDFTDDPGLDGWQAIYSNVGYTVAGGIVGAVAQAHGYTGYEHYVWDTVGQWSPNWLSPGQATSLALIHPHRATDIPHRAVGYYDANWGAGAKSWQQGDAWDVTEARASWIGPAGGWALTIGDLTRIVLAYRHNKIVNAATRSLMETPLGSFADGPEGSTLRPYGLGLFVDDVEGTFNHGGDIGPSHEGAHQSSNAAHWSWWPNVLPGSVDVGMTMICNNGRTSGWLYSRAKDIVEALQEDPNSRPVMAPKFATQPSWGDVDGDRYRLDASSAYVLAPAGVPLLPSAANPVDVTADLAHNIVRFTKPGPSPSAPGPTLGQAAAARLSGSGRLVASGGSLQVGVGTATVPLRDVSLSLQVASDGSKLFDGAVTGTVDARTLVGLSLARSVGEVCSAVAEAHDTCVPCLDGARACFVTSIGGLQGRRLP